MKISGSRFLILTFITDNQFELKFGKCSNLKKEKSINFIAFVVFNSKVCESVRRQKFNTISNR